MSSELMRHHPRNTHKPHLSCSVYRALTKDLLQEKVQQLGAAVAAAGLRIPGCLFVHFRKRRLRTQMLQC